jgi:nitric oxide reductase NorQ protein
VTAAAPYYRDVGHEREVFLRAHANRLPMLLKGPTGSGKSRFVEAMAHALGRPLVTVACNEDTTSADLLGRWLIRGGDTVWQDGPATSAVRQGAILYLDEVAEARPDVIVLLHPLSDHRRELFLDRLNEQIAAPPEFMLVASYNPGYQRAGRDLKASTKQRFVCMSFDYPPPDIECEVVRREAGVEQAVAQRLVAFASKVRKMSELALVETVSTRCLIHAGKLSVAQIPMRLAARVAIVEPLTDDSDTLAALVDLVALSF